LHVATQKGESEPLKQLATLGPDLEQHNMLVHISLMIAAQSLWA